MAYVGNIAFTVTAKQLEKALEGCAVAKVNTLTQMFALPDQVLGCLQCGII